MFSSDVNNTQLATIFGGFFVISPGIAAATSYHLVNSGGRVISHLTNIRPGYAGVLGLIQNLAATLLWLSCTKPAKNSLGRFKGLLISHTICGGALYGLSAAAFKAGWIASSVTLPGAAILILANFAVSYVGSELTGIVTIACE